MRGRCRALLAVRQRTEEEGPEPRKLGLQILEEAPRGSRASSWRTSPLPRPPGFHLVRSLPDLWPQDLKLLNVCGLKS